jgi:hypothetical protein
MILVKTYNNQANEMKAGHKQHCATTLMHNEVPMQDQEPFVLVAHQQHWLLSRLYVSARPALRETIEHL